MVGAGCFAVCLCGFMLGFVWLVIACEFCLLVVGLLSVGFCICWLLLRLVFACGFGWVGFGGCVLGVFGDSFWIWCCLDGWDVWLL